MRIAVLSDLHANAQALEAVMNDVVNQGCEHVFCLGDIALAGPQPKEVIEYVMAQNTWTVIQGNTDKMIAQMHWLMMFYNLMILTELIWQICRLC